MKLAYDAQGQRFRKQIVGGTALAVYFAYDLQGQLLGEYTLSGSTFKPLMEYIWLEGQPVAAVRPTPGAAANSPNSAQEVFYLHTDHLGTPRVALDTAGRVRWRWMGGEPFGLSPAETNPNGLGELNISLRLPGQQYDGFVGLHYNYFRDYDPTVGRYVQSDPIGLAGGINTYGYVDGNPLSYVDPRGLDSANPFGPLIPPGGVPSLPPPEQCEDKCKNPVTLTLVVQNVCAQGDSNCVRAMQAAGLQGPYFPRTVSATYSRSCLLLLGVGVKGSMAVGGLAAGNYGPGLVANGLARVGLPAMGASLGAAGTTIAQVSSGPLGITVSLAGALVYLDEKCKCSNSGK